MPECEVTFIEELADSVFALSFTHDGTPPVPGQFVHIKCGDRNILRRPISVCDYFPGADGVPAEITVVFEVRGEGTEWLSHRNEGDTLDVLSPLGNGFTLPSSDFLLVGGGIGAAPLLFAANSAPMRAETVLGFRSVGNIILSGDFDRLSKNFTVATDDGSFGHHGTVAEPVENALKTGRFSAVLACGPRPMLRAVAEIAERYGVACQVSMEERMACGVGACLVCICKTSEQDGTHMRRVCKDGPVFDAREVVW